MREDREEGDQSGADEQRLRDGGVPDLVGVGLGAVPHEVEAGAGGEPREALRAPGQLEPGGEEAGVWAP